MTVMPRDIAGLLFAAFGLGAVGGVLLVLASGRQPAPKRNEEAELQWQGKLRQFERNLGGNPYGPG
jgi:hypothetical protein